ncbi:MAG TPA: MBL fold metallo-hydrolase [Ruminiclostridium sp.]|nr:MBL fold metallo-hydrolase [Ruminiclostridium sp.]
MRLDFIAVNKWLGKKMFLVVLSAIVVGCLLRIPNCGLVHFLLIALFAYMTFVTSLGTSLKNFIQVLGKPWIPLLALLLIHIVTPLTAWLLGSAFYWNDAQTKLGLLVGAAVPVGVTAVIWTDLTQGSMIITLIAVTLDTLIVPLLLPLYYLLVVGRSVTINYISLFIQLIFMVTIPSLVGMLAHDRTGGKTTTFSKGIGGATSKLALFIVVFFNTSLVSADLKWSLNIIKMTAVVFVTVAVGYAIGYVGALCIPNNSRGIKLAMIYTVGMRNISCGLVIAITYFPPASAIPITLCMLFQQPIAAVIPSIFKFYDERIKIKNNDLTKPEISTHAAQQLTQVADNVYTYADVKNSSGENSIGVNAGAIIGRDGIAVVAPNISAIETKQFLSAIRSISNKPIRYIITTQNQHDHFFGNYEFAKLGATVIARENRKQTTLSTARVIPGDSEESALTSEEATAFEYPVMSFYDFMTIDLGDQVIELRHAQTEGDTLIYLPDKKVLFTGDIPFTNPGEENTEKWCGRLTEIKDMDTELIIPVRGAIFDKKDIENMKEQLLTPES